MANKVTATDWDDYESKKDPSMYGSEVQSRKTLVTDLSVWWVSGLTGKTYTTLADAKSATEEE